MGLTQFFGSNTWSFYLLFEATQMLVLLLRHGPSHVTRCALLDNWKIFFGANTQKMFVDANAGMFCRSINK